MIRFLKRQWFPVLIWSVIALGLWWSIGSPRPAMAREQTVAAHPWDWLWPIRWIVTDPYWFLMETDRVYCGTHG
jgi:hypothetical protein